MERTYVNIDDKIIINVIQDGAWEESGEDTKRFYHPYTFKWKCSCENDCISDRYFSYPPYNAPFSYLLYCGECDKEIELTLRLNITLDILKVEMI